MKWQSSSKKRSRPGGGKGPHRGGEVSSLIKRAPDGRTRLVLHEEVTGERAWRLVAPLFDEAWQDVLTESVANIAARRFERSSTYEATLELGREALDAFSAMCRGWLSTASNGEVACQAGCSHCCHQTVGVTPLEAFVIVEHLTHSRTPEQLSDLIEVLSERVERTRNLSAAEQYSPEFPCVFLANSACSIYEVRPLVCRGMNSLDADACRRRMFEPEVRARFLDEGKDGVCFLEPIQGAKAVSAGLQFALADLFGLDMKAIDLHVAVEMLLKDALATEPRLGQRWHDQERLPFKSA